MDKTDTPLAAMHNVLSDSTTQREAAKKLGISVQYLSDILAGRRAIGPKVLRRLGFKRVIGYERRA